MFEVLNEKQAVVLLKAKYLVHVERHTSLNLSWGIVTTDILEGISDEKIGIRPVQQFDSQAYKWTGKMDHKSFFHLTVFLNSKFLLGPDQYLSYIRKSLFTRTYRTVCGASGCHRFGSTQQRCASNLVCGDCGDPEHGDAPCPGQPHCVYCCGAHAPGDWKWPLRNFEPRKVLLFYMSGGISSKSNLRSGLCLMHQNFAAREEMISLFRQTSSLPRPIRAPLQSHPE
jgi:hypothetical protein